MVHTTDQPAITNTSLPPPITFRYRPYLNAITSYPGCDGKLNASDEQAKVASGGDIITGYCGRYFVGKKSTSAISGIKTRLEVASAVPSQKS